MRIGFLPDEPFPANFLRIVTPSEIQPSEIRWEISLASEFLERIKAPMRNPAPWLGLWQCDGQFLSLEADFWEASSFLFPEHFRLNVGSFDLNDAEGD